MRRFLYAIALPIWLVACGGGTHYDVHCSGGFAEAAGAAPDDTVFKSRDEAERFVQLEIESVRKTWTAPSGRVWKGECTVNEHEGGHTESPATAS